MCFTRRRTKQEVHNSRTCVVEVNTQQKSGDRGGGGGCCGGGGGGGGDLSDDNDYEDSIKTGRNQDHYVGTGESGGKNDGVSPGDTISGGGGGNNIKGGGKQNHGGWAAKNGGKNDGMTPGDAETINSSGGGGENNIWGRGSRNQGDHRAAKNGGIYNGMSPGDAGYINIGGAYRREKEDDDANSGGGRNHNGHMSKKVEGRGGNMSHMGPTDFSDAESSDTSVDELPRDVMGSTKANRHEYARPQSEINYAPAPVMQPYPVVNSYVHFFGEKKTKGCSIM